MTNGQVTLDVDGEAIALGPDDIEVAVEAAEGFAAAGGRVGVVNPGDQARSGAARPGARARDPVAPVGHAQDWPGLVADRVQVAIDGSPRVHGVVEKERAAIAEAALATAVTAGAAGFPAQSTSQVTIDGEDVTLALARALRRQPARRCAQAVSPEVRGAGHALEATGQLVTKGKQARARRSPDRMRRARLPTQAACVWYGGVC